MTDRAPFEQALRQLLKEKEKSISTHPTVGELVAYHDGQLAEEPSESLRDHVALCSACAKTLLELAVASEAQETAGGAVRPELWDDLRSRLRGDDGSERAEDAAHHVDDPASSRRQRAGIGTDDSMEVPSLWQRLFTRPTIVLLASCVVLLLWGGRLQLRVGELSQPHIVDGVAELQADDNGGVRGAESSVKAVPAEGRSLIQLNLFNEFGYSRFRIEILAASESAKTPLWSSPETRGLPNGSVVFEVPPHFLESGLHTIRLYGGSGEEETLVAEYKLRVK